MSKPPPPVTEVLTYLKQHGRTVSFKAGQLQIEPPLAEDLRARLSSREDELISYLRSQLPEATKHGFTVIAGVPQDVICTSGVCIACGIGWRDHGQPPIYAWTLVSDPDSVELIDAQRVRSRMRGAA